MDEQNIDRIQELEESLQSMSEVAEANFQDYIKERNKVIGLDLCRICCGNLDVRLEAKEKQFKEMVEGMKKEFDCEHRFYCSDCKQDECKCEIYNQALDDILNKLKE